MRDLHIHLSSGTELSWPLDDDMATGVLRVWNDYQRGERIDDPVLRIAGDDDDPDGDSRFPLAHVIGVQSFPARKPGGTDEQEASDDPS